MSGQIVSELGTIMDITEGIAPEQSILVGETQVLAAGTTGAVGEHNLVQIGTTTPLVLPEGYTVTHTMIRLGTTITAGAGATISIGRLNSSSVYEAAFSAATVYTDLNLLGAMPMFGTVVNPVTITLEGGSVAKYKVAVDAASAGRVVVYFYMQKTV